MKHFSTLLMVIVLSACQSGSEPKDSNSPQWHGSMWGLAQSLSPVIPILATPNYEPTSQEKKTLATAINDLTEYSKTLTLKDMAVPSHDPSLKYVAMGFSQEMVDIKKNQKKWSFSQKQKALRNVTRYCGACHTRTRSASTPYPVVAPKALNTMGAYTKGNYYLAVRQFGKALVEFEQVLQNKQWAKRNPELWNQAALKMLATSVRVHDNANLTLELLSSLFDGEAFPKDLKKAAYQWRQDAKQWDKEQSQGNDFKQVSALLKKAQTQDAQLENSGLLLNLRAMAGLNKYLKEGSLKVRSEQVVLFHSGVIATRLANLGFDDFPESYFKACVEIDSNSKTGHACKKALTK